MCKSIMQQLHDSEINCAIFCFYDSCWTARIGDEMNGFKATNSQCSSYAEAENWLAEKSCELFPDSAFAKRTRAHAH